MNWRYGVSKWADLTFTERSNWLSQSGYAYTFCTYSFGHLPKSVQESFLSADVNMILRQV